jgi:predicted TIM-barrel fold metal-dependent hydrolase
MRYDGPIVDVDVHHNPNVDSELTAYLPSEWKEYAARSRVPVPMRPPTGFAPHRNGGHRADSYRDGVRPGSSYKLMCEQLFDTENYFRAVLTHNVGDYGAHLNPYLGTAMCTAANDWCIDTWLSHGDPRLYSVMVVNFAAPVEAAKEVRRVGGHERIVSVLMAGNAMGKPLGDPIYDPIYEASVEMGLSIAIHPAKSDRIPGFPHAGGAKSSHVEDLCLQYSEVVHYLSSLIVHGTFEKFPSLRLMVAEYGIDWIPGACWRLDENYELLKLESPWVKRRPSEYIHDHVKFSTQPVLESADSKSSLFDLLATFDGIEDMLCYSSDYPHYTMDDLGYVARLMPKAWHRKVFCDNGCEFYGWAPPAGPDTQARQVAQLA